MKSQLLLYLFITFSVSLFAQTIKRIEIKGKVTTNTDDKEGITIYNQNTKNGTTTNKNGEFKIKVAENDVLEFAALQFQDFAIIIDDRIIKSKQVSVRLVEQINKLDEVVVLPYDLSGNLTVDVDAVRTYNVNMSEVFKGEEDFDDYKFSADNKTKVENPFTNTKRFTNGLNIINIAKAIVPKNDSKSLTKSEFKRVKRSKIYKRYDAEFIKENFRIPTEKYKAFILYVEEETYDERFLKKSNEMYLLNHLQKQSQRFLKLKN